MGPKPPKSSESAELFRSRLENLLDHGHELYRLAGLIEWGGFDREFGQFYRPLGRPAKPTRLMVGLSYLKHIYDLSDEAVCERWRENPYWQFLCGNEYFEHDLPCDPSSLTRWRNRIGPGGMEKLLAATLAAGLASGTVKPSSLERVIVDTTVQPKAIAHPTDSQLYLKAIRALVRHAKRHGVTLRQAHTRLAKRAAAKVAHTRMPGRCGACA
jgi:transposase, IS5 family